jgi:hypothetical protein
MSKIFFTLLVTLFLTSIVKADGVIFLPLTGQGSGGRDINYLVTPPSSSNGQGVFSASYPPYIASLVDPKWAKDAVWLTPNKDALKDLPKGDYAFTTTFTLNTPVSQIFGQPPA